MRKRLNHTARLAINLAGQLIDDREQTLVGIDYRAGLAVTVGPHVAATATGALRRAGRRLAGLATRIGRSLAGAIQSEARAWRETIQLDWQAMRLLISQRRFAYA